MASKRKSLQPLYEVLKPGFEDRPIMFAADDCKVLRVTLSSGNILDIELWEREPGLLQIRGISGSLLVRPHCSNIIFVSIDR